MAYLEDWLDDNNIAILDNNGNIMQFANITLVLINNILSYTCVINNSIIRNRYDVIHNVDYAIFAQTNIYRRIDTTGYWTTETDYIVNDSGNRIDLYAPLMTDYSDDITNIMQRQRLINNNIDIAQRLDNNILRERYAILNMNYTTDITNIMIRDRHSISNVDYTIIANNDAENRIACVNYMYIRFKEN